MLPINEIICFEQDTKERKQWFKSASFAHPAKMVLGLQIYLIEHYTKIGETILDPMAGSGTVLVGCALGRNIICVELEAKFVDMQKANWEKIKSLGPMLGYKMGDAIIFKGDARSNELPLWCSVIVDKIVTNPPYAEANISDNRKTFNPAINGITANGKHRGGSLKPKYKHGQIDKIVTSPPYAEINQMPRDNPDPTADRQGRGNIGKQYSENDHNIGNLPYGEISAVISSPPYGNPRDENGKAEQEYEDKRLGKNDKAHGRTAFRGRYADAVITSPPYEGVSPAGEADLEHTCENMRKSGFTEQQIEVFRRKAVGSDTFKKDYNKDNQGNIGNLKSDNYLEAMLSVYQNCHKVLRDKGLLCLVVKNFIRDKKIVRLDLDTIKLCEKAGFVLKERLKRKLTQQSFWRIIYQKKYPDAPKIEFEDVLIFVKDKDV